MFQRNSRVFLEDAYHYADHEYQMYVLGGRNGGDGMAYYGKHVPAIKAALEWASQEAGSSEGGLQAKIANISAPVLREDRREVYESIENRKNILIGCGEECKRETLHLWIFHNLVASLLMCLPPLVHAEIKLSSDWITERTCTGSSRNTEELASLQRGLRPRPVCTQTEVEKVEEAAAKSAEGRSAAMSRVEPNRRDFEQHRGFKLQIDGRQHYLEPIGFMTKSRADEVCTPSNFKGQPTYRCNEGQRHAVDCHILIFNENFEEVGYHRIMVKEPYQFYCNGVPAVGVLNASDNLLLTTLQYFPIDRRHAGTVAEVGQGWSRMTVLLRLTRNEDGQVSIEQDDVCLGSPP